MRTRVAYLIIVTLSVALAASPAELWIPIAGNAQGGNFFRSDARIFNPSGTGEITIQATYLPVNTDNSAAQPVTQTLKAREMVVFDNVVQALFDTGGFGAIRLKSDADFVATSRTFTDATCGAGGTFGQFIPAFATAEARTKGVVLQLSASSDATKGFRSNVGFANVNGSVTTVNLTLWTSSGAKVADGVVTLQPFGATISSLANIFAIPALNITAGYVTFSATQPVIGYGSVVDNRSADQIFIAASEDAGSPVAPANVPDLQVAMTVDNATPATGANASFSIIVTNAGQGLATALQLQDILPSGLTFAGSATATGTFTSGTGIWDVGALASGATAQLQIVATATGPAGTAVQNCANVFASSPPDVNTANDRGCATVTPTTPPPAVKEFTVTASQFTYDARQTNGASTGNKFTVNKGDHVILHLTSSDVTHGFSMAPFVPSKTLSKGSTVTVEFDATQAGSFGFVCTVSSCGSGHGSMSGTMTVKP